MHDNTLQNRLEFEIKSLNALITWFKNMPESEQPIKTLKKIEELTAWSYETLDNAIKIRQPNFPDLEKRINEINDLRVRLSRKFE